MFDDLTVKKVPQLAKSAPSSVIKTIKVLRLHKLYFSLFYTKRKLVDGGLKRKAQIEGYLSSKGKKGLNVGCGTKPIDGFINSDIKTGVYIDITKKLPFPNNALDVVFHEHVFEHIKFPNDALFFLKETRRVLKKGGVLRFAMPDFESYAKHYLKNDLDFFPASKKMKHFSKETRVMEVMNHLFKQHGAHEFVYDFKSAAHILKVAGFKQIAKKKYNQSLMNGWKHDHWKTNDTMYIEAVK